MASRCLTGHSLKIHIHQHIGIQLHLVWKVNDHNDYMSIRCSEREFTRYGDLLEFCKGLKNGAFEGLCDCVYAHFLEFMKDKIEPCHLKDPYTHILRKRMSYVPGNVHHNSKTKEETCFNVSVQCRHIT